MTIPDNIVTLNAEDELPGRWVDSETGGQVWQGESHWLTRAGQSTLEWVLGKPHRVWHADGPDGPVYAVSVPPHGTLWRIRTDDGYRFGTLSLTSSGCRFVPAETPEYQPEHGGLEAALWDHAPFRERINTDSFAEAVNHYLRNKEFRQDLSDTGRWALSWRTIGGMIASMRNKGEIYLDFYLDIDHGPISDNEILAFEEMLEAVGWHDLTPEEYAIDHGKALTLLGEVENRVPNTILEADRPRVLGIRPGNPPEGHDPISRMHRASSEGKVSQSEFNSFFNLVDLDHQRLGADPGAVRQP